MEKFPKIRYLNYVRRGIGMKLKLTALCVRVSSDVTRLKSSLGDGPPDWDWFGEGFKSLVGLLLEDSLGDGPTGWDWFGEGFESLVGLLLEDSLGDGPTGWDWFGEGLESLAGLLLENSSLD